jgi:hypothetical protein
MLPENYQRCIDNLCDGVIGIDELMSLPIINDYEVVNFLDQRDRELTFVYNSSDTAAEVTFDINQYCTETLQLDKYIMEYTAANNSFKYIKWSDLLTNAFTAEYASMSSGLYYDNETKIDTDFKSLIEPLYNGTNIPVDEKIDLPSIFPDNSVDVFNDVTDANAKLFAKKLYSDIFLGRGIVEGINNNELYKLIIKINDIPSLLARDYSFTENIFNGYYPYNNTIENVKQIRGIISFNNDILTKSDIDSLIEKFIDIDYSTSTRSKLSSLLFVYWIALKSGLYSNNDLIINVGPIISDIIGMMDFLKSYIISLSSACKRYMNVN